MRQPAGLPFRAKREQLQMLSRFFLESSLDFLVFTTRAPLPSNPNPLNPEPSPPNTSMARSPQAASPQGGVGPQGAADEISNAVTLLVPALLLSSLEVSDTQRL